MTFLRFTIRIAASTAAFIVISACNHQKKAPALTTPVVQDTAHKMDETVNHGYNELADANKNTHFTVSDYNTDNPEIENIVRPAKNTINTKFDTALLFNIWVQYSNSPHADFWWTGKSFFVVDYDGDGDMPFTLKDSLLTVYYNDFIQKGKVISVTKENLTIHWDNTPQPTNYIRFEG